MVTHWKTLQGLADLADAEANQGPHQRRILRLLEVGGIQEGARGYHLRGPDHAEAQNVVPRSTPKSASSP